VRELNFKKFKGKVQTRHNKPGDYVLKKASDDSAVQMPMIHRCEFVN